MLPNMFAKIAKLRSERKKHVVFAFDPVVPDSPGIMSSARALLQASSLYDKLFVANSSSRVVSGGDVGVSSSIKTDVVVSRAPQDTMINGETCLLLVPLLLTLPLRSSHPDDIHLSACDPVKIPISPRHSDIIFLSSPVPQRRQLGPGYDGADDDCSTRAARADLKETQSQAPASLAITTSDSERGDSPRTSSQMEVERERDMTPMEISSDGSEVIPAPGKLTSRTLISGGYTLTTPRGRNTNLGAGRCVERDGASKGKAITISDDDDAAVTRSRRRAIRKSYGRVANDPFGYSSDIDDFPEISHIEASSSRQKRTVHSSRQACGAKGDQGIVIWDDEASADGDDDDESPVIISTARKRRRSQIEKDLEDRIVSSPTRKGRATVIDDSGGVMATPQKRLRLRRASGQLFRRTSQQEKQHVSEDEGPRHLTRTHAHKKTHRTTSMKQLELIRRRTAGEKIDEVSPSDSDGETSETRPKQLRALTTFWDDESDKFVGGEAESEACTIDDDNFVVDDDDEAAIFPYYNLAEVPLEFSHHSHKPMKEYYRIAVEWIVQNKINPAFDRKNPIYALAFHKLEDKFKGLVESKLISPVWRKPFVDALKARPKIKSIMMALTESNGRRCDACGRSKHAGQYYVKFRGMPYDKDTLEDVEPESGDEAEDESDKSGEFGEVDEEADNEADEQLEIEANQDADSDGEILDKNNVNSHNKAIPHERTKWWIGSDCRANAEMAHALIHWRNELNFWAIDSLRCAGHLTAAKLREREGWSEKKRREYALDIVDGWHRGVGGDLLKKWRYFNYLVDAATDTKGGGWDVA